MKTEFFIKRLTFKLGGKFELYSNIQIRRIVRYDTLFTAFSFI